MTEQQGDRERNGQKRSVENSPNCVFFPASISFRREEQCTNTPLFNVQ